MDELRDHIIKQYKKDKHNWMVEEIIDIYTCEECGLDFPRMSQLKSHMDVTHSDGTEHTLNVDINDIKVSDNAKEEIKEYQEKTWKDHTKQTQGVSFTGKSRTFSKIF